MKEPTRWKVEELNCCFDADMIASPTGEYVEYSDYKQLQAEVERLNELANDPYRLSKGWRPIETAPKDGTAILVYDPYSVRTIYWSPHYEHWMRVPSTPYEGPLTHWMPLPKPPTP